MEVRVEVPGVQHQKRVHFQELDAERLAVARAAVAEITRDLVDGEQVHPLLALRLVGRDLGIERLRYPIQGDTPLRLQHELLLEPEPLLEIFELGEEGDDLVGHVADGTYAGKGAAEPGGISGGEIVQVQDFALEVEVQLTAEEASQVLVDEVVEAVLRRVAFEVLLEHRPAHRWLGWVPARPDVDANPGPGSSGSRCVPPRPC